MVETNASSTGIGDVLMQEGHPLAFIADHWVLNGRNAQFMRRSYWPLSLMYGNGSGTLWEIMSYQNSLKWLLQQKILISFQLL